ncbi:protein FAM220A-like [Cynocephalus volans]|uniref:protein FAM220A-like n=1 Tax=Cynocephalus volans TaxID=110931 RepID=UPI002FC96F74
MREGRGALGTCLAKVKDGRGEDLDTLSCSLKKRTQKGSPCSADKPSWMNKPVNDVNGDSHNEVLSLETKDDLNEADLLLHNGSKVRPYLKESIRRNSASAATLSKAVGLFSAPAEEHFAGVPFSVGEALKRDCLGRGPKASDSHRGQRPEGEPWVLGLPYHQKLLEMGILKDGPLSPFLEGRGSELELSCLHSVLFTMLHTHPEVLLNDETKCVSLDWLKPMFSEQRTEYKKMLSSIKSTSNGL